MPSPKSTARVDHDLVQEARVDALVDAVDDEGERRVAARSSVRTSVMTRRPARFVI